VRTVRIVLLECGTVLTVWYCFIGVWNCFHSLVLFLLETGTILTIRYCFYWSVELFLQSGIVFIGLWNCSHSLVLFYWSVELFSQFGIVLLECGTVLTVWYCFIGMWNCSHKNKSQTVKTFPHPKKTIQACENSSTPQKNNTRL
jgi:hypothetical protein